MNIVVLAGGLSTERDVSFKTGDMVTKALQEEWTSGYSSGCVYGIWRRRTGYYWNF